MKLFSHTFFLDFKYMLQTNSNTFEEADSKVQLHVLSDIFAGKYKNKGIFKRTVKQNEKCEKWKLDLFYVLNKN